MDVTTMVSYISITLRLEGSIAVTKAVGGVAKFTTRICQITSIAQGAEAASSNDILLGFFRTRDIE
jgi:hypothetical protein